MVSHSNHLYLMPSNEKHCNFWFHSLGLASSIFHIMPANEVLIKYGMPHVLKALP